MYTTLFWIIIAIITCDYLLNTYLDFLNKKQSSKGIPTELKGLYDAEKVEQQKEYFAANYKFAQTSGLYSFLVMLLMFFLFGFAFFDNIARGMSDNTILIALLFFGMLYIANNLITIPFAYYKTFKIEERFGFNKMTPKLFVTDILKEWIMTALLGGVIISLLMLIYQYTGSFFWIIGWGFMSLLSIFMMMFYSNLIVPLFNKQTPLEEGELRNQIEDFCQKVGFELDNLFVIDGSKRTTKANAYFSGLGKKKRIVLYDTLIEKLTPEEIV
ncbi:MAG: M48 family metallopeptidase, partial [Paludibacteraceae bacterium]|nr:M48 family metallopeptidase [Paludibacteraceae bacterium]